MNILVIGGGGREHALVWKLSQSPRAEEIFVAPGNGGTASIAHNLNIRATDIPALAKAAKDNRIDLAVVGPEAPLAEGIVDYFQSQGIAVFGPTKAAAQIESSKVFARELMQKYAIPSAQGAVFSSFSETRRYIETQTPPLVVKADGLAAGKGVTVAQSREEALNALSEIMGKRVFGSAGDRVIVEECLSGKETSLIAFTDGMTVVPMVPARDYKRIYDSDKGPNTGGMGSYSPPEFFSPQLASKSEKTVLHPAVAGMRQEGFPYKGALYAGLMLTPQGIKVLEFNARFGDPETQVILPRLKTDLLDILLAVVEGNLHKMKVEWSEEACVGVVLASSGYPGSYKTGFPVSGLNRVDNDIVLFHAGTKLEKGQVLTDGGRVLTVVAKGKSLAEARAKVYDNLPRIHFEGCYYRKDIAAVRE